MVSSYDTHGFIDWYEPVHKTISHLPEVLEEVRDGANALARRAEFKLNSAKHRTGDSHIEVIHKRQSSEFGAGSLLDSYVMLVASDEVDPERPKAKGWPAAMSIEMGNESGGGGLGPLRSAAEELSRGVKQH